MTLRLKLAKTIALVPVAFILASFTVCAQAPVANFTASPIAGCSPLFVTFQDLSTGSPTSWLWDFGNGNTSTLQNPSSIYLAAGKYTVTLTVKNANGTNKLTRAQYIDVYQIPTVTFTASRTNGCFPLKVQFTDNSTAGAGNTSTSWFWDFGDGNISTEQNPVHTYTTSGSFAVTLKVTNDKGCYRVVTIPNYIQTLAELIPGFSNNQPTVCQPPADVTFTNSSVGPGTLSYQWNFGDGATSTDVNPLHTYTVKGLYDVSLVVISSTGCTDTLIKSKLIPVGAYSPTFSAPDTVCINSPASFLNTSSPVPSGVIWNFGDATTSTDNNPSKVYSVAGFYTVKMVANYGSCIDSVSKNITVLAKPVPDFTAPVVNGCQAPLTVNFQDQSTNAASWQWKFGDGSTSSLQNPSHSYTNLGNYDVTLIVANAFGCIDSITKPAFVKIAKPVIAIPTLPTSGCVPFTINPVATITSVDAVVSYLWDFGDGTTSILQNPSHTYPTQGTYTVSLKIVTATGCTETLVINNAVKTGTVPTVDFTASPMVLCVDETVQFTNNSSPATDWLWSFGDHSTSTEKSPSHLYSYSNDFDVSLTVSNNGCISVLTKPTYIRVNPPESYFEYFPNCIDRKHFTFIDRSDGALTWFWDFGDGTTSTDQNTTHDYAALGSYKVSLTTTNGSCTNIQSETINVIDENPEVSAMPNPGCKEFQVSLSAINIDLKNISSYFWDFGDASTSTVSDNGVNHTYNTSGNYTISLTTTDINGCTDNITKTGFLRINGPTANFSATNTSGCQGLITTFNDLSSTDGVNAITNWQWDFGDGSVQNFATGPFLHAYLNAGTYSVKLKVTDASGCSDTLTIPNLIITTDPIPGFASTDTLTCPGATVNLSDTSIAINHSSVWDFGDGITSTNSTHIYTTAGLYNVKLRITDQYGCADSLTKSSYIRVDNPVADYTLSDSISSCTPFEVNFKNSSTYFTSILWNFGDGGISAIPDSVVHYYGSAGSFQTSLIVTSPGGCKDTAYKTISVYDTIGSYVHYTPLSGCSPITVAFTAFTPGKVTYLWDFGDGNTQTTTTPNSNHIFTSFGDYVPRVIMQDPSGCLVPILGIDTIHITGSKSKFGADTNLLCDSGYVKFTDSTTFNNPITNWNWSFGDGTISTEQNPTHPYSLPGIYTVSLNTLTTAGCRDTITRNNFIKVVLGPVIGITGDSIACVFNSMTQQGVFFRTDTSAISWQWNFPNGNSSALQNPPTQTYNTAGNFSVTAIATNSSGCKDTATKNIFVNPIPTVDMPGTITILSGESILLPATYSPNVTTWQWTPQSTLSCGNCAQPVATPRVSTSYNVLFTDNNGCHNSQGINIVVACKDGNIFIPNTFSPNGDGSNDKFYPRGKGIDRIHVLRIFNRWGELVFEKMDFPVNDVSYSWDGTYKGKPAQAGVYIFQAEVYCSNGELIKFAGNVSLIL